MQGGPINIIILGGGTAGWMTAAALVKMLPSSNYSITLVESEQIGTVGVGEATIPHIRQFNKFLEIDENDFIRATNATYKLAICFEDWGKLGDRYFHPFGSFGHDISGIEFQHYWLKLREKNMAAAISEYSLACVAAMNHKFDYPSTDDESLLSTYTYAFHIDAGLYARYLRNYAETKGVVRREGKVVDVVTNPVNGFIESIKMESGETIQGDFFIDCSGFASVLIEKTLKTGFEDWSQWLPCNRAIAIPSENVSTPAPYTRATARDAGWQWCIPLQHRSGNGYVYSNNFISDDEALVTLLKNLDGKPVAEPNHLKFIAGRRKKSWNKNCVAIGLSSGFLEPLESTSIYLVQMAILKFLEFVPGKTVDPVLQHEFNRALELEYCRIRDFLILHYHATTRDDSPFWRYCQAMDIPDDLKRKMQLFKKTAHVEKYQQGLFMTPSWIALYFGQGIYPEAYDSRLEKYSHGEIQQYTSALHKDIAQTVQSMPMASSILAKTVKSFEPGYAHAALDLYRVKKTCKK
ncbi:MAG: tryptophan halogenase family protein [Cellvibrio sp.]|uniref:tryptophan halogenase family protein n=1 Tax=Cellvibrio sp. TaxID=1965322 RepID=UPI0031A864C8